MMHWVQLQPSYILYSRPFRETSLLLEAFSQDYGRVSLIAKGVKSQSSPSTKGVKRPRFQGLLEPFIPLLISWRGRSNLLNLSAVEPLDTLANLRGQSLFCAWYLNELLLHTLKHFDTQIQVFKAYHTALHQVHEDPHSALRQFEKALLMSLGVMPQLDRETKTGDLVEREQYYIFSPTQGVLKDQTNSIGHRIQGATLLAAHADQWHYKNDAFSIKRLFRVMLDHVLEGTKIQSRALLNTTVANTKKIV